MPKIAPQLCALRHESPIGPGWRFADGGSTSPAGCLSMGQAATTEPVCACAADSVRIAGRGYLEPHHVGLKGGKVVKFGGAA